jgi:hypothetical protein
MKQFKTVAIFTFSSEYIVLQHLLEQEGLLFFKKMRRLYMFYLSIVMPLEAYD